MWDTFSFVTLEKKQQQNLDRHVRMSNEFFSSYQQSEVDSRLFATEKPFSKLH